MKNIFFLFLLLPVFLSAQQTPLIVEGVSPALYITHKVAPKENYYSVGRIYNVSPKDIAPFNKLQLESGLTLGQVIKIPLNSSNFLQEGNAATDETFIPLYYKIKDKEGLYRVAKNHNDLPLETLKQWNNIKGDAVGTGTQLVVGYLKVKSELSALAKTGAATTTVSTVPVKTEETKPVAPQAVTKPVVETEKAEVKLTRKEKRAAAKTAIAEENANNKVVTDAPVAETPKTASGKNSSGSGFKALYNQQKKDADQTESIGVAGVFKSTSGWTDSKYYCLHSNSSAGTIIKVSNPANGKFIFAKVLDNIPYIKQNEGLIIVISNAAAEALGATEANFNCTLNYAK